MNDSPGAWKIGQELERNWLRLTLQGITSNSGALGAIVRVASAAGVQTRYVTSTRSYLSQCELPVTFGLGASAEPVDVEIVWPDGEVQKLDDLPLDGHHTIQQGVPEVKVDSSAAG